MLLVATESVLSLLLANSYYRYIADPAGIIRQCVDYEIHNKLHSLVPSFSDV